MRTPKCELHSPPSIPFFLVAHFSLTMLHIRLLGLPQQTRGLKNRDVRNASTALEARSLRRRRQQGQFLLRTVRTGSTPGHAPRLAEAIFSLRLCTSSSCCACLCSQMSPFHKDTIHAGLGPTLSDLALTCSPL